MNIANFEAFWMEFKLVSKSFIWEVCDKYIQLLNQHYCHFGLLMAGALLPLKSALCLPYSVILITLFFPHFCLSECVQNYCHYPQPVCNCLINESKKVFQS